MKRTLILYVCLLLTVVAKAQPKGFSFYMLQPTTFAEVTTNAPQPRRSHEVKGARVKNTPIYKGVLLPIVKSNAKWHQVELSSAANNSALWLPKAQCRTLTVAPQAECIMPPVFQVESADGSIGGVIEGPDAHYQVRIEGNYSNLPFSVGHAPGSDNYTLQFMVAGNNPNYTYVITTSFVTTHDAKDKPSLSSVRDEENGRVVYETLYLSLPRTLASEQTDAYLVNYLTTCSDAEFSKIINSAFPAQGLLSQVTVYFKATNGKRYAYTYRSDRQPKTPYYLFKWNFVQ